MPALKLYATTPEDAQAMERAFKEVDTDGSGLLDADEVLQMMKAMGIGDEIGAEEVQMMISAVDVDGGGEIDFEEFKMLASLQQTFDSFDNDGSGKIDADEMRAMMESMGIVASAEQVVNMIKQVDLDGNNEVDFPEFCKIVKENAGAAKGAKGFSFAGVIQRLRSGGPQFIWRDDELAKGKTVGITTDKRELVHKGAAWGAFLMNEWLSASRWGSASVLMQLEELSGEAFVGVAGKNYQARDAWAAPLDKESHASAVHSREGKSYVKGRGVMQQACKLVAGDRVSLEIDMQLQTCLVKLHGPDGQGGWTDKGQALLENIHPEVAVVVAFGEGKEGEQSRLRIVGSSCENCVKANAADLQKSEEEQRGMALDDMTKEALKMQT
jgi:Ca2+-binding EF-hand superfamily protein